MMLYEDKAISILLPDKPSTTGHAQVVIDRQSFGDVSEEAFAELLSAASFLSNALFEQAAAQGSNIIVGDVNGVRADVLVRQSDDGLGLRWDPKPARPEDLDDVAKRIKDRCDYIGQSSQEKSSASKPTAVEPQERIKDDDGSFKNYLLRSLDRIP